jgi:ankyrin repeat protein
MELLRDAGCDTSATRSKGANGMFLGVHLGHANVVTNLLEHDSLDINAREENLGMTPYLLACTNGRVESMNLLKSAGCDTKVRSFEGMTDLILAAHQGHPDILQALLDDSEGKEQMNLEGESRPYLELRSQLGMTAFLYACANGNISCMGVLMRARADVTAKWADGRTALDFAHGSSCRDTGVHVLEGIGVNQALRKECTPPHTAPARLILKAAVYGDIVELQQLLDEEPQKIDERGAYGHTAFHMSIILNQIDCMKALMKAGCDVTLKDNRSKTGLIYAATFGYTESMQILLDEGEGKGQGEGENNEGDEAGEEGGGGGWLVLGVGLPRHCHGRHN